VSRRVRFVLIGLVLGGCWLVVVGLAGWGSTERPLIVRAAKEAIAAWRRFPVDASPRPVIMAGGDDLVAPPTNRHGVSVFDSGGWTFHVALPSGPGSFDGYHLISASAAARIATAGLKPSTGRVRIVIIRVRLGHTEFFTDRGGLSLPAWLFYARNARRPDAVLAVPPYTTPKVTRPKLPKDTEVDTEEEGATSRDDGRWLSISFTGGPAGTGPCDDNYSVGYLAGRTAVAFAIREIPGHGSATTVCDLVGYRRQVVVRLDRPLGQRVLIDAADAIAIPVSPHLPGLLG
jgi:hypothetical protein